MTDVPNNENDLLLAPDRRLDQPDPMVVWRWIGLAVRPVVAWVLVAAGFAGLIVSYFGVSRNALVAKQIPFLVSGGLTGIGAVFLGGVLLGIHDLGRILRKVERVEQQIGELHAVLLQPAVPRPGNDGLAPAALDGNGVVSIPGGQLCHREGCPMVAEQNTIGMTVSEAAARGLEPCKLCDPPVPQRAHSRG
jgi:hypothetical protein